MALLTESEQQYLIDRHNKLVDQVRRMRGYQKEFFKYRSRDDLKKAKQWEKEVDKRLEEEVEISKNKQKELF